MSGMSIGSDTPLEVGPWVAGTTPSEVQPADELPGPAPTGPPRPEPTKVNTSTEKATPAAPVFAVVISVTVKLPDVAVRSKKIAQFAEPPLLAGPGLAFKVVCAKALPEASTTAESARNLESVGRDDFMGTNLLASNRCFPEWDAPSPRHPRAALLSAHGPKLSRSRETRHAQNQGPWKPALGPCSGPRGAPRGGSRRSRRRLPPARSRPARRRPGHRL